MTATRNAAIVASAGMAAEAAVLARRRWARHLTATATARDPSVTTDDGVQLHVETDGCPVADVTVLFAHGIAARLEEFGAQRHALRDRARLVLFDQRGHGRSGWGDRREATLDRLGHDLEEVMEATSRGRRVVLVGHSMGGMSVIALAARRPDLFGTTIVGVALLSTSAGHLAQTALPRWAAKAVLASGAARAYLWLLWLVAPVTDAVHPFRRRVGRRWLRHKLFGRGRPPEHLERAMDEMWRDSSLAMTSAFLPSIVNHDKGGALRALRGVPTLVLSGTADATIPHRHSERLVEEIGPSARLVLVPGAGHMVNMTHVDPVNDALIDLLHAATSRAEDAARRTRP